MTKGKKTAYTMADVAKQAKMDPKNARSKFRRLKKERPFDHSKTPAISAAQLKAAVAFLKTDYRANA